VLIESLIRRQVRNILLQERIRIKDVTKNPPGSKHDVTVFAEISPTMTAQVGGAGIERSNALRNLANVRNYPQHVHDSLKKDIIIQGNYDEDDSGVKRLRLKLYDKDIPAPYKRPTGWTPRQLLVKLRQMNREEVVPYDEGGEIYGNLEPTPDTVSVPKMPKREETSKTKKRKTKRTTRSIANIEVEERVVIPLTSEQKGQIFTLLMGAMQIAANKNLTIVYATISLFKNKINKPITNLNETELLQDMTDFLENPDVQANEDIYNNLKAALMKLLVTKAIALRNKK